MACRCRQAISVEPDTDLAPQDFRSRVGIGRWRATVEETFRASALAREGFLNTAPLPSLIDEAARTGWAPLQLWHLFVLETWLRHELASRTSR